MINYKTNKDFLCMIEDAELLHNLLEQQMRPFCKLETDYVQPGIGSGQPLGSILREILKSINNHLDNLDKHNIFLP